MYEGLEHRREILPGTLGNLQLRGSGGSEGGYPVGL